MKPTIAGAPAPGRRDWIFFIIYLGLLTALATLRPLAVPDEGRYGDVGRWMFISGDWVTPRLDGLPFFHKPPLLYWMEASFFALFGVHPWVGRLVPSIHALITCAAVYAYARRFLDLTTARRAMLMLASGLIFLGGAQYINCDMLVATWIVVTILAFAASLQTQGEVSRRYAWGGFLAAALGFLSKGLIGIALPGLVILLWMLLDGRIRRILDLPWFSGGAIFAAVGLPWFVMAQHRYGEFFDYFFIQQQFTRYVGAEFNNQQPWPFYVACLLLLFFPWSVLVRWRSPVSNPAIASTWRLCWVWLLTILVFFSLPKSKLVGYILPVVPSMALLAAIAWPVVQDRRATRWALSLGALLFAIGLLTVAAGKVHLVLPTPVRLMALVMSVVWGWVLWSLRREIEADRLFRRLLLAAFGSFLAVNLAVAAVADQKGTRLLVAYLQAHAKAPLHVVTYSNYPFDLPFYLNLNETSPTLGDWQQRKRAIKDDGDQQLLDGLLFDPAAGRVLQEKAQLSVIARSQPDTWLVASLDDIKDSVVGDNYCVVERFGRFALLRSRFLTLP